MPGETQKEWLNVESKDGGHFIVGGQWCQRISLGPNLWNREPASQEIAEVDEKPQEEEEVGECEKEQ